MAKQCIHKVRDKKVKRQCKFKAVKGSEYCRRHANKIMKTAKQGLKKKKVLKSQVIKLASMGLILKDIAEFFSVSLTFIHENHETEYKKGRALWEGTKAGKVEQYASLGMSQEAVANALGIASGVMVRDFGQYYDRGAVGLRLRLRAEQVRVALADGNPKQATMLIFLGKNYLGQKDKFEVVQTYDMDQIERVLEIAAKTDPAVVDQFIAHIDSNGNPMEFINRLDTGRAIEDAEFEEIEEAEDEQ